MKAPRPLVSKSCWEMLLRRAEVSGCPAGPRLPCGLSQDQEAFWSWASPRRNCWPPTPKKEEQELPAAVQGNQEARRFPVAAIIICKKGPRGT